MHDTNAVNYGPGVCGANVNVPAGEVVGNWVRGGGSMTPCLLWRRRSGEMEAAGGDSTTGRSRAGLAATTNTRIVTIKIRK